MLNSSIRVFFKIFFLMWTIFKVFIEFVTILLLPFFIFWFFDHEACGILAPGMRDRLCISCIVG